MGKSCSGHAQVCLRRQRGSLGCGKWQHSPWHRGRWKSSGMATRWETKKAALITCREPSTAMELCNWAKERHQGLLGVLKEGGIVDEAHLWRRLIPMEQQKRQLTVADALEGRCRAHVQHTSGRHHHCYWLSIQLSKELPGPCSYPNMVTLLFI
jgi:hypothetical protein